MTKAMPQTYNPGVHRFSIFVVLWTIFLFVAGALVTSNNAALSVPDWPKSFGRWFPPMRMLTGGAFFEHSHRQIAGILAVLVLVLAVWLWRSESRPWVRWIGALAVAAVLVQAVLGGEVVRQLLQYWLPVMHAVFAQVIFAAVVSIAVFTSRWWLAERPQLQDKGSPSIRFLTVLNAVVLYVQALLGAGFRHNEIPIWPHLAGALVAFGVVIWTAIVLRRRFGHSRELSMARVLLHAIFGMQFLLGLGAYWSRLSTSEAPQPMFVMVAFTVIHTVFGAILLAFSVMLVLMCYRLISRGREVAATTPRQVTTG
ncbi:MAG: COX15/CtaA family protein [Candidatus Acidiferrum sp.]